MTPQAHENGLEPQNFKLAVEGASDHIVITDAEGTILYANAAAEAITGFSRSEMIGKKVGSKELWGGLMEREFYEKLWKTIKYDKLPFKGEIKNRRKNGVEYFALTSISPVLDASGEVAFFIGIERDITKEKDVDRAKTEFVSLASHQLRTPISSINWNAEMLLGGDLGTLTDQQRSAISSIYESSARMTTLVGSLLNVSRLELGTFNIRTEILDVVKLVREVIAELEPKIKQKSQQITRQFAASEIPFEADPELLRIVWQNLISNAVNYTPDHGQITISVQIEGQALKGSVQDSGIGIPKSEQEKIFQKLFRANNASTVRTDGTGLGLYIVKSVLEKCGGKVWFESEEGKGTTFYFTLPASK